MSVPPEDGPGDRPDDRPDDEVVGSLAEEAAKLLGALGGWAREQGGVAGGVADGVAGAVSDGLGGGVAAAAAQASRVAADAVRQVDQHVATGAAECTWCPVCRTVHALRQTSPEVRDQLVVAATALLQAGAGLLTQLQAGPVGSADRPSSAPVERIDLDDDPDDPGPDPGRGT